MIVRELIGKITLQEDVNPIDTNKIANTFVIHIPDPLAEYYNSFSEIHGPNSIVFVTKTPTSFEKILRATKNINKKYTWDLEGAKCEVKIGARKHSGIRVKGIPNHHDIEKVQLAYLDEGFEFAKSERISEKTDAIVRVNRFFELFEVEKGIYQSQQNKDLYYITIPKNITWEVFRDMTYAIKNNVSVTNYDIVKGIFYENEGITDMLRLIKTNITLDMVKEIQKKYLEKLA
jgi:hypothetical protein